MKEIVQVRSKVGESKYAVILRVLKCGTFAQAVEIYGLQNHPNAWEKLESLAANIVSTSRRFNHLSRRISKLLR